MRRGESFSSAGNPFALRQGSIVEQNGNDIIEITEENSPGLRTGRNLMDVKKSNELKLVIEQATEESRSVTNKHESNMSKSINLSETDRDSPRNSTMSP